jgi:hypothetical protein
MHLWRAVAGNTRGWRVLPATSKELPGKTYRRKDVSARRHLPELKTQNAKL